MLTLGKRARKPCCQSSCLEAAAPAAGCCCVGIAPLGGPGPSGTPPSSRSADGAPASSASSPSSILKNRANREFFGMSSELSSSSAKPESSASKPEPSRTGSKSLPRFSGGPKSAPSDACAPGRPLPPLTPATPSNESALLSRRALGPLDAATATPDPIVPTGGTMSPGAVGIHPPLFPKSPCCGGGATRSSKGATRSCCCAGARKPIGRTTAAVSREPTAAADPTGPTGPPTALREPTRAGGSFRARAASREAASRTDVAAFATAEAWAE
mmetsp:Transcript_2729/g.8403  ORF Transcript_2729/g.8403 Transcript_2729/m.8403 type:complete len:271 (-) Transcript_2729:948-1760(-)|eukprot:scaffold52512_cov27-Tisochrysis_lutea.AAC.1